MKKHFVRLIIFLNVLGAIILLAQVEALAQITGTITDSKTGKQLQGVQIFINQTTAATQSDDAGQFTLENALTGFHEVVLYKKGYALYKSPMRIQTDRAYNLKLTLNKQAKQKSLTLTNEEKELLKNKIVANDTSHSISILNENEIASTTKQGKRVFAANAVLTIQNNTLGYRMNFYLMDLSAAEIAGAPTMYEPLMPVDMQQQIAWEKNRKEYFAGTQRHWLMALLNNQFKEEGYRVTDEHGTMLQGKDLVIGSALTGYQKLNIEKSITIHFTRNATEETTTAHTNGVAEVNATGVLLNAKTLMLQGDMTNKGLAWQLPLEYLPVTGNVEDAYAQTWQKLREHVYVHTDKPYYYPGEPLWFKGYINYNEPKWRDSLSKVMYVELINPKKEITLAKTLKIDSGVFYNDFILPDTLPAGNYYLRAYTNLNRNFGDSSLFVKAIPILNITDKVDYALADTSDTANKEKLQVLVTADKPRYKPREKITLTIHTKDNEGKPLAANLSMSVTDAVQVVAIPEPLIITNSFAHDREKQNQKTIGDIKYPVEFSVGFTGRFFNNNDKPEQATLTILQLKPRDMMMTSTDENGFFSATGFDFYDSATFAIKADKAKDQPYGKIKLLPREVPPMNFEESDRNLAIQNTQSPQRIISEYEVPKDAIELNTIEVRATRIQEEHEKDYRVKRPYGKPDYVLKAQDLNTSYGDLLLAIQGKVPGMIPGTAQFYKALTSITSQGGTLVTLNDVALAGDAEQILHTINPNTVESIEFTTRINVLYGSQGANGVISIYTKKGFTPEQVSNTANFQSIKVSGYSPFRDFSAPDYSDSKTDKTLADYRSTIYWNPNIATANTGVATVSFFAADLEGNYRIVLEGITVNGEPVRCAKYVTIDSN